VARSLDAAGVVPRGFLLSHFAAYDFVAGTGVAADLDAADIDAAARIHIESEIRFVAFPIEHGIGVDVGERIAERAEVIGDGLGRGTALFRREGLAFLDGDHGLDLVFEPKEITGELDAANLVGLALVHGQCDGDVLAVGRDRKSTLLNSSHVKISYAVFCLKKKKTTADE